MPEHLKERAGTEMPESGLLLTALFALQHHLMIIAVST